MLLMTKSLTINDFKKTTKTDKKLIKQWRNATTKAYTNNLHLYFQKSAMAKILTKKKYL